MSAFVVVDTSVFVDFFRSARHYSRLEELFRDDRIILSEVVRLELFAGVRATERFTLAKVLGPLRRRGEFASPSTCESLVKRARGSGLLGSLPDIMILADAQEESAAVTTNDRAMKRLATRLGLEVVEVA